MPPLAAVRGACAEDLAGAWGLTAAGGGATAAQARAPPPPDDTRTAEAAFEELPLDELLPEEPPPAEALPALLALEGVWPRFVIWIL